MWCNQIFSLIKPVENRKVIQNIVVCDNYEVANKIAKVTYGEDSFAIDTTLIPVEIGYEYFNGVFYNLMGNKVLPIPTEEERLTELENKTKNIEKTINPAIDYENCTVEELKTWQINQSKKNLQLYLEVNPLHSTCHKEDGVYYSITSEKQTHLSQMIMVSQMAMQSGVEYQPSWNETGQPCTYDWTIEELQQLAFEIESVVRPLINKQQQIEREILSCDTKEDVLAININFE